MIFGLFVSDQTMVKTKQTKRVDSRKCPMCSLLCHGDVEFSKHVVECAKHEHTCTFCEFTSHKECNVKRHMKRAHKGLLEEPIPLGEKCGDNGQKDMVDGTVRDTDNTDESDSDDDDWTSQDPGELLQESHEMSPMEGQHKRGDVPGSSVDDQHKRGGVLKESDLLAGRVYRKKTTPSLPGKHIHPPDDHLTDKTMKGSSTMSMMTQTQNSYLGKRLNSDVWTQTDFAREISKKTIKRIRDGEIDVEEITEEKFILY